MYTRTQIPTSKELAANGIYDGIVRIPTKKVVIQGVVRAKGTLKRLSTDEQRDMRKLLDRRRQQRRKKVVVGKIRQKDPRQYFNIIHD